MGQVINGLRPRLKRMKPKTKRLKKIKRLVQKTWVNKALSFLSNLHPRLFSCLLGGVSIGTMTGLLTWSVSDVCYRSSLFSWLTFFVVNSGRGVFVLPDHIVTLSDDPEPNRDKSPKIKYPGNRKWRNGSDLDPTTCIFPLDKPIVREPLGFGSLKHHYLGM